MQCYRSLEFMTKSSFVNFCFSKCVSVSTLLGYRMRMNQRTCNNPWVPRFWIHCSLFSRDGVYPSTSGCKMLTIKLLFWPSLNIDWHPAHSIQTYLPPLLYQLHVRWHLALTFQSLLLQDIWARMNTPIITALIIFFIWALHLQSSVQVP